LCFPGADGYGSGYVTNSRSWSAVNAKMPNIKWHITLSPLGSNILNKKAKTSMKKHKNPQTPNLAICGWVLVTRPKPCFGNVYQRAGW